LCRLARAIATPTWDLGAARWPERQHARPPDNGTSVLLGIESHGRRTAARSGILGDLGAASGARGDQEEPALEAAAVATWTFMQEVPIPDDVNALLVEGEKAVAAFKTFRDSAIFTSKRLIVRDAQGLTGKKVEIYSLPYSSINMWSSENAGRMLDLSAEIELWTRAGHIKVKVGKGADIRRLDSLLAWAVLQ
jgi:hypothetical protein